MTDDRWAGGWQAQLVDHWPTGGQQLLLYRYVGDNTEVITGFTEGGTAVVATFAEGTAMDVAGLHLPRGAAQAIAEKVKPGPAAAEVARLQEALDIERRRIDNVLDQLLAATAGDEDLELDEDQALDVDQRLLRAAGVDDVDGMSRPSG